MTHHSAAPHISKDMEDCIQECERCHALCLQTLRHCLELGGAHASPDHVMALLECAEACRMAADAMLIGSPRHARACALCAEACRVCEESCRRLGNGIMKECADACASCAEACEAMAGGAGA